MSSHMYAVVAVCSIPGVGNNMDAVFHSCEKAQAYAARRCTYQGSYAYHVRLVPVLDEPDE